MHGYVARPPYAERAHERRALLDRAASRLVAICAAMPDLCAVHAFGSYATGTTGPSSDLDALVVRRSTLRRAERDLEVRRSFDVSVALDLIVVTPDEFERILPTTSFGKTILATARRLDAAG